MEIDKLAVENGLFRAMLAERNTAFENDDFEWAARILPTPSHPIVVIAAFHKARYECTAVSDKKRLESQSWLAGYNATRFGGLPIAIGDPLPDGY
jgi:hypothetical protein